MQKIILISVPLEDLQTIISNCVNSCLKQHSNNQSQEELPLTIREAAKFIDLAVPTLYSLVGKRAVPFFKKRKRLYFYKQDLTAWINSGRNKTASEIEAEAVKSLGTKRPCKS